MITPEIADLNNKLVALYGKLVKLEYDLKSLDKKQEMIKEDYVQAHSASPFNKKKSSVNR